MASSCKLLFSLFSLLQITLSLSSTLFLPLHKDTDSNQYLTRIYHGSKLMEAPLVVDLNSPFLWLDCSSSQKQITTVNCRSIQCTSAAPNSCPSNADRSCSIPLQNPTTGVSAFGELVEGTVSFRDDEVSAVDSFLFSCAPSILLSGLPSSSKGVLGLGRTRIGAISQISHFFEYPKKFSLCLSSENGMILDGNDEIEVFKSMIYTPLLDNGDSSYSINLKSVKIQNKKLDVEESLISSIKISTIDPYSKMETRVYQEFVRAFLLEAESLNMPRVQPIGGFDYCYDIKGTTKVPIIELVLQSEMVKWRIFGHNSMVKINEDVMCLGFLDGGYDLGNSISIVLGGHQLEDNLLEFDLGSSMLGFSSSLLKKQTSCSQLSSLHRGSIQSL
ncbi:unnamed protein product [Amaranthus hypochondriacus]